MIKYDRDLYIDSSFFGLDEDMIKWSEKLVKCRKPHECAGQSYDCCQKTIMPGDYAVREKALIRGTGWSSCYVCLSCIENWLQESHQVPTDDEIKIENWLPDDWYDNETEKNDIIDDILNFLKNKNLEATADNIAEACRIIGISD